MPPVHKAVPAKERAALIRLSRRVGPRKCVEEGYNALRLFIEAQGVLLCQKRIKNALEVMFMVRVLAGQDLGGA